jgi:ribosome-associated toxin RatA of RatAB toxin-antitoxin module
MPTVLKSVLVQHSAAAMYALVDAVEHYPEFLPWCGGAHLIERTGEITHARIDIDYHGLKSSITTRNRKEPPEWMHLDFTDGPFASFQGRWRFVALGADGCRVEFSLDYSFESGALDALLGPVLGHITATLVDRFVARADAAAGA